MAPFVKTSCLYFIINPEPGTIFHCVIKLLPIFVLLGFIWAQGLKESRYNQWIMAGLALCAIGDTLLVWQEVDKLIFIAGMAFFGIGHILYMIGFGFRPFGLKEFLFSGLVTSGVIAFIVPCLSPPLSHIVAVYAFLLGALWWRAVARFKLKASDIPWRKIYASIGATLFVVSDTILAVNKFCYPVPYESIIIMTTYYGAQMFIAFSIINSRLFNCPTDDKFSKRQTYNMNGYH